MLSRLEVFRDGGQAGVEGWGVSDNGKRPPAGKGRLFRLAAVRTEWDGSCIIQFLPCGFSVCVFPQGRSGGVQVCVGECGRRAGRVALVAVKGEPYGRVRRSHSWHRPDAAGGRLVSAVADCLPDFFGRVCQTGRVEGFQLGAGAESPANAASVYAAIKGGSHIHVRVAHV